MYTTVCHSLRHGFRERHGVLDPSGPTLPSRREWVADEVPTGVGPLGLSVPKFRDTFYPETELLNLVLQRGPDPNEVIMFNLGKSSYDLGKTSMISSYFSPSFLSVSLKPSNPNMIPSTVMGCKQMKI